jgi:soluble lytic murein transglycosylase-like protein
VTKSDASTLPDASISALPDASAPACKLLLVALLSCCCVSGAPKLEDLQGGVPPPSATAIERQRASVGRQMARISETANRARQAAEASRDRQRASIERQRRAIDEKRSSFGIQRVAVERQQQAARPARASFSAAAQPVAAVTWDGAGDADCRRIQPAEIGAYVDQVARRESLAPELLRVVIARESSFRPCAVSHKGAMGMMQLMPGTAADLGVVNPFDAEENIDGGARYLSYLLQRFDGDLELALAAYNAGPRRVDDYRGVPPIPETVSYVSSILRQLRSAALQSRVDTKPVGKI